MESSLRVSGCARLTEQWQLLCLRERGCASVLRANTCALRVHLRAYSPVTADHGPAGALGSIRGHQRREWRGRCGRRAQRRARAFRRGGGGQGRGYRRVVRGARASARDNDGGACRLWRWGQPRRRRAAPAPCGAWRQGAVHTVAACPCTGSSLRPSGRDTLRRRKLESIRGEHVRDMPSSRFAPTFASGLASRCPAALASRRCMALPQGRLFFVF